MTDDKAALREQLQALTGERIAALEALGEAKAMAPEAEAEDHLAWFILDVVSQLDLNAIERAIQSKDARGQRPYHPSMMVTLLVYAYCTGVFPDTAAESAPDILKHAPVQP